MSGIDPHTLVIVVSFQALLMALVLTAMRLSFPKAVDGIHAVFCAGLACVQPAANPPYRPCHPGELRLLFRLVVCHCRHEALLQSEAAAYIEGGCLFFACVRGAGLVHLCAAIVPIPPGVYVHAGRGVVRPPGLVTAGA